MKNISSLKNRFDSSKQTLLSNEERKAINKIITLTRELTGVQLNEHHQAMIISRLRKRLIELEINTFADYVDYYNSYKSSESSKLITLLTTHYTYFFREFAHFEFLINKAIPALLPIIKARKDQTLRIWVAASSRGQEVYSLAMYLDFHLKRFDSNINFEILGTDIDSECIAVAKNGVYPRNELKEVPLALLGDHWIKGSGEVENYVKVKKNLRSHCQFEILNLLELKTTFNPSNKFDLIFCRNVFIYFNADQIKLIANELLARMIPEGYFFIGISESLSNLNLPIASPGPSVYRHKLQIEKSIANSVISKSTIPSKISPTGFKPTIIHNIDSKHVTVPPLIRVLCVDDSSTILMLLKKILSKENGFEVVGVANNGIEAKKQLALLKPDVMTLDIHMPEQTGIEYLEQNYKLGHPPVIMVTSVSRENADLAGRSLSLGASDYVEKPAMSNMSERGDEIRNKLRYSLQTNTQGQQPNLRLDHAFQKASRMEHLESKIRIIVFPLSARKKIKTVLSELSGTQPPCLLFVDGFNEPLSNFSELLTNEFGQKVINHTGPMKKYKNNDLILMDINNTIQELVKIIPKEMSISILVFGEISTDSALKLKLFKNAQFVLEDLGSGKGSKNLTDVAYDVVPHTSFAYLSNEYFSKQKNAIIIKK